MEPSITPPPPLTQIPTASHTNFPSIGTLFKDSWNMFKGALLNLIVLNVIYIVISVLILVGAAALLLPLGGLTVFQAIQNQTFKPEMLIPLFISSGIILVFLAIFFTILGLAVSAAQIFIAGNYKEKHSLGLHIKKSFPKIFPLFVVGIITGFITTGGFLLFVIPGIIFTMFFMFAGYEVVLNNQGILGSINRSIKLVSHNFGEIFVRILLLIGFYSVYEGIDFFISFSLGLLSSNYEFISIISLVWSIFSLFVSFFIWIYILCYSLTLYRQSAAGLESEKGSGKGLLWMFISSIVGWFVGLLLIVTIGAFLWSMINSQQAKITKSPNNTLTKDSHLEKNNPEVKKILEDSYNTLSKMQTMQNRNEILTTNDANIRMLKEALKKYPENETLWLRLATSYTYINSDPNFADDMILASQKVVDANPESFDGYFFLGLAYSYKNDAENTILQLEKANRIDSQNALLHYNLGMAYDALEIRDQALKHYNQAIDLYQKDNDNGQADGIILKIRQTILGVY